MQSLVNPQDCMDTDTAISAKADCAYFSVFVGVKHGGHLCPLDSLQPQSYVNLGQNRKARSSSPLGYVFRGPDTRSRPAAEAASLNGTMAVLPLADGQQTDILKNLCYLSKSAYRWVLLSEDECHLAPLQFCFEILTNEE